MPPNSLDFAALNHAAGYEAWNDTFAYWLLVLHDPTHPCAQDATEAQSAMSFQYDAEEQTEDIAGIATDPELIPQICRPIAPVTLALRWSPFPAALQALGPPAHLHTHQGNALAVFAPCLPLEVRGTTADEQHFAFLLREACVRAGAAKALVLLVGSPGWAYDSADYLAERPETQQLMRDFGFAYTLRAPAPA